MQNVLSRADQTNPPLSVCGAQLKRQRVTGTGRVSFKHQDLTRLDRLYQDGSAKIRIPKTYAGRAHAYLMNTAGGLTGGDRIEWSVELGADTAAAITTPGCERAYRTDEGGPARVENSISVGVDASLIWVPQETLLYDRSTLERSFEAELAQGAELLLCEAIILGRPSMGEAVDRLFFHDHWRVRRDGRLVFADEFRLSDSIRHLRDRSALLSGAGAFATILYCGPGDLESHRQKADAVWTAIAGIEVTAGISALGANSGMERLIARFAASDGFTLRRALRNALAAICGGESLPGEWS